MCPAARQERTAQVAAFRISGRASIARSSFRDLRNCSNDHGVRAERYVTTHAGVYGDASMPDYALRNTASSKRSFGVYSQLSTYLISVTDLSESRQPKDDIAEILMKL